MEEIMKTSKCLMGIFLGAVLIISSAFAANTLQINDISVKVKNNFFEISFFSSFCKDADL